MIGIIAKTQFEGIHRHECAPEGVAYLRIPHRHIFGVCVEVQIIESHKSIEPIMLKKLIDAYVKEIPLCDGIKDLEDNNCGDFAVGLYNCLASVISRAEQRYWKITVTEDGENGAYLEHKPEIKGE